MNWFISALLKKNHDSINAQREKTRLWGAWGEINKGLLGPSYSGRNEHGKNMRGRKRRLDIGKLSFKNRKIENWNS